MQNHIRHTKQWIQEFVIGMNFCPFAKSPFRTDKIRYLLTETNEQETLLQTLMNELLWLHEIPAEEVETSLIIHPNVLQNFEEYNDFLAVTDALLEDLGLEGIFQIASFHPDYQFADAAVDAVENYTNRAPYPMLHLLRESSVTLATAHYPDVDSIPDKNIAKLRAFGIEEVKSRLDELTRTH